MGVYRLILAMAVLASHIGFLPSGWQIGVMAVISFYIITGYVMTSLINKSYMATREVPSFYLDRAMRLLPQYLFYFVASLVLIRMHQADSSFFLELSPKNVLLNALILPLGYYQFLDLEKAMVIPQAWSLGLECTFYLAIPFILVRKHTALALCISVAIALMAYASILDPNTWGYRLLPGTLFIFLCGSLLTRYSRATSIALALVWVVATGLALASPHIPGANVPYNFEVMAGISIGLPIIALLKNRKFGVLNRVAGDMSYGVFLNHYLLLSFGHAHHVDFSKPTNAIALCMASCALAYLTFYVLERPVIALRHRIRNKHAQLSQALSSPATEAAP